MEKATSIYIK